VLFNTVVPHIRFSRTYVELVVGVLGTTISPFLFFWQSMHRVEDMREEEAGGTRPLPLLRRSRIDAAGKESRSRFNLFTGMGFSNIVIFAAFPTRRGAPVFYGLCAVGTVGGMALSLLSVNPITLLVFVAVVNGVAAAPFIVVTMCSFPPIERSWGVSERPSGDAPRMAAGDADGRCCGGAVCNRGRLVRPSLASSSV